MIRHMSLLTWGVGTTDEQIQTVVNGLRRLRAHPGDRAFAMRTDIELADRNAHMAIMADFDDIDAYRTYADHPAHLEVLTRLIRPVLAARTAIGSSRDGPRPPPGKGPGV